ncbi:hypothetical protein VPNG_03798 [Cytospora leucostoma]|uniref:Uncharacterized protein n=1 Tax=Cytospora leucostoma TaxID=1230097 RepID=A0A423XF67_9PEZI|nr:hypothetical protein VPNG_03798 [Cytospora leucostoma]
MPNRPALARESSCRSHNGCPLRASPRAIELIPAVACSFVTTWYTADSERNTETSSSTSAQAAFSGSHIGALHVHPSPGIMFTSCLVLGCSVSGYLYRHQKDDPHQSRVFAFAMIGSVILGYLVGATLNMVMLGFLPWAACVAMLLSTCGHALLRWMEARSLPADQSLDEKAGLLA